MKSKSERIHELEIRLEKLEKELKNGRIIDDTFSTFYLGMIEKIDLRELEQTQALILNHLDVEVETVFFHKKLRKRKKK